MADFFKSNPMALRHCLLYEYVRKIPIEKSFVALQKTFGPDIIKKKKLNFWFDQFKKGVFDINGDKKPITDMRDVIRSDKNALRACILYESLKYKVAERGSSINSLWPNSNFKIYEYRSNPSFAMYKVFCKAVGKAVMEYREFDFWFYRLLNGDYDLNFVRDKDKKIYELMAMPIDVMKNVVEYLDIFDRMKLAKTSRSLQTFVDDQKLFHHTLKLSISLFEAIVLFSKSMYIEYLWDAVGCKKSLKSLNNRGTLVRGVHFWKQALSDFQNTLKNPKLHLDSLEFVLAVNKKNVYNELENVLKFTHHLHVKKLYLFECPWELLVKIVTMLKPGYLTTIRFIFNSPKSDSMNIVFEMEQWKQAKCFALEGVRFSWPLHHLYHFEEFTVILERLSVDDIRQMKETLFNSPNFEKCLIVVNDVNFANAIEKEFGNYIQQEEIGSAFWNSCHYRIPNSTEYFEIKVGGSYINITRKKR